MAPQDNLEHDEATEAQDLTRLLCALRPPEREVQVPPQVDLTIRAEIWKAQVRRQVIALLAMAHRELAQAIRQALTDNPMLEEVTPPEDEDAPAREKHAPRLTASADDLMGNQELYDNTWQACVPDRWDTHDLAAQASKASGPPEHSSGPPEIIVPDGIVKQVGDAYWVVLNEAGIPRLRLSKTYRRPRREDHLEPPEAKAYLDDKLRSAVWLIRSLEHRRQTLSSVVHCLVARQRAFLDDGLAHLKPLALTEVADALGMHASTVRLVISNKYLATAHRILSMTSFFPERLAADPELRMAYRDLQTALAHPRLRAAVLIALRAFAQAAETGVTFPPFRVGEHAYSDGTCRHSQLPAAIGRDRAGAGHPGVTCGPGGTYGQHLHDQPEPQDARGLPAHRASAVYDGHGPH